MEETREITSYLATVFQNSRITPEAVYLVGSYGRHEGIIKKKNDEVKLYNDLDILVVNWPVTEHEVEHTRSQIRKRYSIKWVDIDRIESSFFYHEKSTCYSVDLKTCSIQVLGTKDFREHMTVRSQNISDVDAKKLFYTRGWSIIGVFAANFIEQDLSARDAEFFRYQLVKLIFAGIDIFLISNQCYVSKYSEKVVRAKQLGMDLASLKISEKMLIDVKRNSSNEVMTKEDSLEFYKQSVIFFTSQYLLSKGKIRMRSMNSKSFVILDFFANWLMFLRIVKYTFTFKIKKLNSLHNLLIQSLLIREIRLLCLSKTDTTDKFLKIQNLAKDIANRRLKDKD